MPPDLTDIPGYESLRPLVAGWDKKLQASAQSAARKKWKEVADEILMFYSRSAAAMWDLDYGKKFWRNIKAPKFRITINKAYEYVAVFGPNLIWDAPYRSVKPKRQLQIPPELFAGNEQLFQQIQQQAQQEHATDTLRCHLLQQWLNYTPRELPGGGLEHHNELAVVDAMLVGRGLLFPQLYSFPGSQRTITGCFRKRPTDLLIDPDFKTLQECKWVALRHTQPHWEVERRFGLPANSLKNRASLETSWHYSELQSRESSTGDRNSGKTSDLIIWYEVWSKLGVGARMTGMPDDLKYHLEEVVGDYAYLAICPECPYPLNCRADKLQQATDQEIKAEFAWPIPYWKDDRWPFAHLDFYPDPESAWPVPPLAPALGELKFINFLVSFLSNRIYSSSRDFWAIIGSNFDEYRKVLEDGEDQVVFPVPPGTEDVRKQIMALQQPETRADAWKILEIVSQLFDKRTGLTEFAYGQNEQGTQDRTAETTKARAQAVGVRPEYMQKRVVAWQGDAATMEGYLTQRFITAQDSLPLMGQAGAMLWQQYIENQDDEQLFRQMDFSIEASSIRRPNKDKDMADFNEMMDRFAALYQAYGELTGDFTPANGILEKFGELKDMDMSGLEFPAKDPNDPQVQLQQQMQQAEAAKTMAEAHKAMSEAQNNPAELKAQELAMEQQQAQQELQMDLQKLQAELQAKMAELQLKIAEKQADIQMKREEHQQDMQFKQQEGQVDLAIKKEQGAQQIAMGQQQIRQSEQQHQQAMQHQEQSTESKVKSTEETTKAKVAATKAIAKAKPKPTGKK
jgi:hypothetical protein